MAKLNPVNYGRIETTTLVGSRKIRNDLRRMIDALAAPETILEAEFSVLEQSETDLFGRLGGKYVRTGDTEASLTQRDAEGAIRRIHAGGVAGGGSGKPGIEFGTSIWYAKFQRTIGPPSGKPRGRIRTGPSKILRITPETRATAARLVLDRIMGRA